MNGELNLPKPKPRDSEPMMVVNELSKIFRNEMKKTLEEAGIPISYRALLLELVRSNGMSQLELAKRTHLKPPTVSITIRKMEEDGYIVRIPSEVDLRVVHVYLTEKGAAIHRMNTEKLEKLEKTVMQGIDGDEKQYLLNLLIKMRDNLLSEFCPDLLSCCAEKREEKKGV